jgi:WASH complex subunit strumpellin
LDEEFRETHMPLLERFYILFENIYKYVKDFLKYLKDLEEGVVFIQQTFDVMIYSII